MTTLLRTFCLSAGIIGSACVSSAVAAATSPSPPPGNVVLARASGDVLFIWDCTDEVRAILSSKMNEADANSTIERLALEIIAVRAPKLHAPRSVSVQIVYAKIGEFNPQYRAATFAGVEHYATLTIAATDIDSNRDKWQQLAPGAPLPQWINYKVTGQLPPR